MKKYKKLLSKIEEVKKTINQDKQKINLKLAREEFRKHINLFERLKDA